MGLFAVPLSTIISIKKLLYSVNIFTLIEFFTKRKCFDIQLVCAVGGELFSTWYDVRQGGREHNISETETGSEVEIIPLWAPLILR